MRRVRVVAREIKDDKDGYPIVTTEVRSDYEGELLAIVGLAGRVVYVVAKDDGSVVEESQHEWKKISLV